MKTPSKQESVLIPLFDKKIYKKVAALKGAAEGRELKFCAEENF